MLTNNYVIANIIMRSNFISNSIMISEYLTSENITYASVCNGSYMMAQCNVIQEFSKFGRY
jgi:hypothetical protein